MSLRIGGMLLVVVAAALTGCGSSDGDTAGTALPLEGTPWTLQSYEEDGTTVEVPEGVTATARFVDGQVSGSGGCNRYSAGYTLDGDRLSIDPVAGTLMACGEPASSVETAFLGALGRTAGYTTRSSTLTLLGEAGNTLLTFAEGEDLALVGTPWSATGINNGNEAVVSLVADSMVTAEFGEDGTVSGSGGCNTYTGSFTQEGSTISIGPLASTLRACEGEGLAEQEAQFLAAMERATQVAVDAGTLELRDDSGALQVSFEAATG